MSERFFGDRPPPVGSIQEREMFNPGSFLLQEPREFRDDFVSAVNRAQNQAGLEVMQLEACGDTAPIFAALIEAKARGVDDVRFHYDRVARRHIRSGEGQAWGVKGRTVYHRGDKNDLRVAYKEREDLIDELHHLDISTKPPSAGLFRHDHVKLGVVDNTVWLGTMNLRALDFDISNFMVKTTDPYSVEALREVFSLAGYPKEDSDRRYVRPSNSGEGDIHYLLDGGVRKRSLIYDKALEMANSLHPGDAFAFISQWPPVKGVFGQFQVELDAKLQQGVSGTFLMSPEEYHHPSLRVARMMQERVTDKYIHNLNATAINLRRQTHVKAFVIHRANGDSETLFGSHNLSYNPTVRNGTRELAMWTTEPSIVSQVDRYLNKISQE